MRQIARLEELVLVGSQKVLGESQKATAPHEQAVARVQDTLAMGG